MVSRSCSCSVTPVLVHVLPEEPQPPSATTPISSVTECPHGVSARMKPARHHENRTFVVQSRAGVGPKSDGRRATRLRACGASADRMEDHTMRQGSLRLATFALVVCVVEGMGMP